MSTASPTTSAPNRPRPSSGSEVPRAAACANCGATLGGPYCAACGQRDLPPDPSIRELAEEAWDAFVSVDGKLLKSVRLLVLRPGEMSARYLAGRRAPFIPPLRLYLACSVGFFLLEATLPRDAQTIKIQATEAEVPRDPKAMERAVAGMQAPAWRKRLKLGAMRGVAADPNGFRGRLFDRAPQAVFVLVPLQAALLALVYRRRRRNFPSHLVVALHTHAALFVLLAATSALAAVLPRPVRPAAGTVFLIALAAYVPRSMRRVYGGRWGPTLARLTVVGGFYCLGLMAVLFTLLVATFWAMGAP